MRQLMIRVPKGQGDAVMQIAQAAQAVNLARFPVQTPNGVADMVIAHVSNARVENVLHGLEDIDDVHISMFPQGVLAFHPPTSEAADQVTSVQPLSPIEVFLAGLQSIGSWKGFLGYAAAGAIVVWIGLFTNSVFLLIAAMLIAPFAGPAMNLAVASARGDTTLLWRSLLRYAASIGLTVLITALLSFVLNQDVVTRQMSATGSISEVAVLLPLVAGGAGALNLVQSSRSSLVSGAATGVLVAAALAPPAGLVGMSAAMGRWDLTVNGVFLLTLQLVGINLSGALVFRLYGVNVRSSQYERGRRWLFPVALGLSVLALAGLLAWQFGASPNLQRASIAQRAVQQIKQVVDAYPEADLIEANAEFTRPDIAGQNSLLLHVYAQRHADSPLSDTALRQQLTEQIQNRILSQNWNVIPLVNLSILAPPAT